MLVEKLHSEKTHSTIFCEYCGKRGLMLKGLSQIPSQMSWVKVLKYSWKINIFELWNQIFCFSQMFCWDPQNIQSNFFFNFVRKDKICQVSFSFDWKMFHCNQRKLQSDIESNVKHKSLIEFKKWFSLHKILKRGKIILNCKYWKETFIQISKK